MSEQGQDPEGRQLWGQRLQCELGRESMQKAEPDTPACSLEGQHHVDKAHVHHRTMPGSPHLGLSLRSSAFTRPGSCHLRPSVSATQELPKYLRGFHKCSREDVIHLAGLIYRVQFGSDRSQLASVSKILKELVPQNLTRLMSSEEWKKVLDRV